MPGTSHVFETRMPDLIWRLLLANSQNSTDGTWLLTSWLVHAPTCHNSTRCQRCRTTARRRAQQRRYITQNTIRLVRELLRRYRNSIWNTRPWYVDDLVSLIYFLCFSWHFLACLAHGLMGRYHVFLSPTTPLPFLVTYPDSHPKNGPPFF